MRKLILSALMSASVLVNAQVGRDVTEFASTPKIGGYFIGKGSYTDKDGANGGDGFSQRLIRFYLDGTILGDFKYRMQLQTNNSSFHMKDFFIEWGKFNEFKVKVGQFKRSFTFENPYNPWNVGVGDYSQVVKKFAGMGDRCGEASASGGRDQGIQFYGDLFPSEWDQHRYLHYEFQLMNGQGINTGDKNRNKDILGTIQYQPIKGLWIGLFGWIGKYTGSTSTKEVTVDRKRWGASVKLERGDWSARAEYVRSRGYRVDDYNSTTGKFDGSNLADGWYATVGVPCTDWLKVYLKYDAYRQNAEFSTMKTIYSLAPNFQLHRNLMFQLQYNYVVDKSTSVDVRYNEIWAQAYVRF